MTIMRLLTIKIRPIIKVSIKDLARLENGPGDMRHIADPYHSAARCRDDHESRDHRFYHGRVFGRLVPT